MPFVILFLAILVLLFLTMFLLTEHHPLCILTGILCALGVWWFVSAVIAPKIIDKETCYTLYDSPDNYQYITVDSKPINMTREIGEIAPDGYRVKRTTYIDTYKGLSGFRTTPKYEFVPPEKEEK